MNNTQYLITLAVLLGVLAVLMLTGKRRPGNRHNPSATTVIMPYLYVEQLNPKTMRCYKRYSITRSKLVSLGATISREGTPGDVLLECAFDETSTVGKEHAVVALDEYGCFIQANTHVNGMSLVPYGPSQDEVAIENGTIVYLGMQPIRFTYPTVGKPKEPFLKKLGGRLKRLLKAAIGQRRSRTIDFGFDEDDDAENLW